MPGTALQLVGAGSVALASAETCRLTAAEQDASFVARVCFFMCRNSSFWFQVGVQVREDICSFPQGSCSCEDEKLKCLSFLQVNSVSWLRSFRLTLSKLFGPFCFSAFQTFSLPSSSFCWQYFHVCFRKPSREGWAPASEAVLGPQGSLSTGSPMQRANPARIMPLCPPSSMEPCETSSKLLSRMQWPEEDQLIALVPLKYELLSAILLNSHARSSSKLLA